MVEIQSFLTRGIRTGKLKLDLIGKTIYRSAQNQQKTIPYTFANKLSKLLYYYALSCAGVVAHIKSICLLPYIEACWGVYLAT